MLLVACGSNRGDAVSAADAFNGEAARDGGIEPTAAAAISLSIRALSMPRLTLRLCRVSGDRFAPNAGCAAPSGVLPLLPLR
jgi:hypothetical protein